jgi:hypothetical protein
MIKSTRRAELEAQGWTACFVADEPRLSEAVEMYESLGMEVRLEPVNLDSGECTSCLQLCFDRCGMIYTRPAGRCRPEPPEVGMLPS